MTWNTNEYASTTSGLQLASAIDINSSKLDFRRIEAHDYRFIALRFKGDKDVRKGYHLELEVYSQSVCY
jgi:hypothetical protein